jgi:hypothetical protein
VYSTYLGGSDHDTGYDVAVDDRHNAFVTGVTLSSNFPSGNALQQPGGGVDAFLVRVNATGGLAYSTHLGGSGDELGFGVAARSHTFLFWMTDAYVAGETTSTNFPTKNPLQSANAGGRDAFVVRVT